MGDHDIVKEEEGFVVCRCGKTWCRESTGECLALHRLHWREENRKADPVAVEGLGEARAALARARLRIDPDDTEEWT